MFRLLMLGLLLPLISDAQVGTPFTNTYFEGIRAGQENARIAIEAQRVALEKQWLEYQMSQGRKPDPANQQALNAAFEEAILEVSTRYTDFRDYAIQIQQLSGIFAPGNSGDFTLERYLEGLYLIARHANDAQEPVEQEKALTNSEILLMVKAGLDDSVVISKIRTSPTAFQTSPDDLIRLKSGGASQAVIKAVVERGKTAR